MRQLLPPVAAPGASRAASPWLAACLAWRGEGSRRAPALGGPDKATSDYHPAAHGGEGPDLLPDMESPAEVPNQDASQQELATSRARAHPARDAPLHSSLPLLL